MSLPSPFSFQHARLLAAMELGCLLVHASRIMREELAWLRGDLAALAAKKRSGKAKRMGRYSIPQHVNDFNYRNPEKEHRV
jgi:hypothetical protein